MSRIERIRKKLNNASGMTLAELLISVMIILLVSAGMTSVVSMAGRQYMNSVRSSESQVLYSTISGILEHELSYATNPRMEQGILIYDGNLYGTNSTITTEGDEDGYGEILICDAGGSGEGTQILGAKAYTRSLKVKIDTLNYDETSKEFTVGLSIGCKGKVYLTKDFKVISRN